MSRKEDLTVLMTSNMLKVAKFDRQSEHLARCEQHIITVERQIRETSDLFIQASIAGGSLIRTAHSSTLHSEGEVIVL